MEFHCGLQLLDGFRTVNVTASVAGIVFCNFRIAPAT